MTNINSYWIKDKRKLKVPFWNPKKINDGCLKKIKKVVNNVIDSGNYVLGYGDYIEKFEKEFAKMCKMKYAVMTGSGTQALATAYKSIGLKKGDEVITTSHTFIATIDQIIMVGAKPVLVDIGEDGLIDPKEIEKAITKNTKAIVPVHLEGNICKMKEIKAIAKKYNLLIVEDACQAIGAQYPNKGDVQCFSFYPAKILGGIVNAGMITTNNKEIADKASLYRANCLIGKNTDMDADFGHNFEPDSIAAAVLSIKIKLLKKYLNRRKQVADIYNKELKDIVKIPFINKYRVYQDYVIRTEKRNELVKFLYDNGIGVIGYKLINNHFYNKLKTKLPKTEEYIAQQLRIPCNPYITNKEVKYIIKKIKEFYENQNS